MGIHYLTRTGSLKLDTRTASLQSQYHYGDDKFSRLPLSRCSQPRCCSFLSANTALTSRVLGLLRSSTTLYIAQNWRDLDMIPEPGSKSFSPTETSLKCGFTLEAKLVEDVKSEPVLHQRNLKVRRFNSVEIFLVFSVWLVISDNPLKQKLVVIRVIYKILSFWLDSD